MVQFDKEASQTRGHSVAHNATVRAARPDPSLRKKRSLQDLTLGRKVALKGSTRFTRDGKAVAYPFRDKDADNLWLQPLDGSPGKQITNFKSERIADFHWFFDGSKMGLIRGHADSDVVLIRDQQQ